MSSKNILIVIAFVYWNCNTNSNKQKQAFVSETYQTIRTSKIYNANKLLQTTFNSEQIIKKEDTLTFSLKTDSTQSNHRLRTNKQSLSYLSVFASYKFIKEKNNTYKWLQTPINAMTSLGYQKSHKTTSETLTINEKEIELIKITVEKSFSAQGSFSRGFSPYLINECIYFHPTYGILVNLKEKQVYEKNITQSFTIINELKDFQQRQADNEIINEINRTLIENFISTKEKEFETEVLKNNLTQREWHRKLQVD